MNNDLKDWIYSLHQAAEKNDQAEVQRALSHVKSLMSSANQQDAQASGLDLTNSGTGSVGEKALAMGAGLSRQALGESQIEPESKVPVSEQAPVVAEQNQTYENARATEPLATLAGQAIPATVDVASGVEAAPAIARGVVQGVKEFGPMAVRGLGKTLQTVTHPINALGKAADAMAEFRPSTTIKGLQGPSSMVGSEPVPPPPPRTPPPSLTPEAAAGEAWQNSGRPVGFQTTSALPEPAEPWSQTGPNGFRMALPEPPPRQPSGMSDAEVRTDLAPQIKSAVQSAPPEGLQTASDMLGKQSVKDLRAPISPQRPDVSPFGIHEDPSMQAVRVGETPQDVSGGIQGLETTPEFGSEDLPLPPPRAGIMSIPENNRVTPSFENNRGAPSPAQIEARNASPVNSLPEPVVQGKGMGRPASEYNTLPEPPQRGVRALAVRSDGSTQAVDMPEPKQSVPPQTESPLTLQIKLARESGIPEEEIAQGLSKMGVSPEEVHVAMGTQGSSAPAPQAPAAPKTLSEAITSQRDLTKQGKPGEGAKVLRKAVSEQKAAPPENSNPFAPNAQDAAVKEAELSARENALIKRGMSPEDARDGAKAGTKVLRTDMEQEFRDKNIPIPAWLSGGQKWV